MHGYDIPEALYINCHIHSPLVRGSGLGWTQYDNIVKIDILLLYSYLFKKK